MVILSPITSHICKQLSHSNIWHFFRVPLPQSSNFLLSSTVLQDSVYWHCIAIIPPQSVCQQPVPKIGRLGRWRRWWIWWPICLCLCFYKYKYSWWIIFAVSLFKNLLVKIWWVEPLTRTLYYILQLQQPWRLSQEVLNGCAVEPCPAKQWQTVNSESISRVVQPPPLSSSQVFVYSQPPIECLALCLSG